MSDIMYVDGRAEFSKFTINTKVYTFFKQPEAWYFRTFSELDYESEIVRFRIIFTPYQPRYVMGLFDFDGSPSMKMSYNFNHIRKPYKDDYLKTDDLQFFADSIKAPNLNFNLEDGFITLSIFEDYNNNLVAFTLVGEFDVSKISIDAFTEYVFKSVNGRRFKDQEEIEQMRSL